MMPSICSCALWPYLCLLQRNVHLHFWRIFFYWIVCFLTLHCRSCLDVLEINSLWVSPFTRILSILRVFLFNWYCANAFNVSSFFSHLHAWLTCFGLREWINFPSLLCFWLFSLVPALFLLCICWRHVIIWFVDICNCYIFIVNCIFLY